MQFLLDILRLLASIAIAFCAGKLIAKIKLPSILGWLIAGMIIGPHALNLLGTSVLDAPWFHVAESVFECIFGLMIGTELIWKKMKKSGPQIVVTTITESLGTFLVVTLVFGIIFWLTGVPLYLAFMFGGIALATAPAPSLSWMTWWPRWYSSWSSPLCPLISPPRASRWLWSCWWYSSRYSWASSQGLSRGCSYA